MLLVLAPCAAAVGRIADNDGGWWNDGATDPWSFGVIDADGDGIPSPAEISAAQTAFLPALKETRSSLLAATDRDQSGKLSRFEAQEAQPRLQALVTQAKALALAIHDSDRNGTLDETERKRLIDALTKVFIANGAVAADTNHDRQLTADKLPPLRDA